MGSLEKLRKELSRCPQGISESDLSLKTRLPKTTVNEGMWKLAKEDPPAAFKDGHLWKPKFPEPTDLMQPVLVKEVETTELRFEPVSGAAIMLNAWNQFQDYLKRKREKPR